MREYTVEEFCNVHHACKDGHDWAVAHCATMRDAWLNAGPEWVIWIATRHGVLIDKDLRLFAVWSARQVQNLMADKCSIDALDVAERFANGLATNEELAAARAAAGVAAEAAARAAWAAARVAAGAAARAAWAAARDAAGAAAWDAAGAAWAAAGAAARAAARAAQAKYLQENTTPNFSKP